MRNFVWLFCRTANMYDNFLFNLERKTKLHPESMCCIGRLLLMLIILATGDPVFSQVYYDKNKTEELPSKLKRAYRRTSRFLDDATRGHFLYRPPARAAIDTIFISADTLQVRFRDEFAYKPIRSEQADDLTRGLERKLHGLAMRYSVFVTVKGYRLQELVPNAFLGEKDPRRLYSGESSRPVHVTRLDIPYQVTAGLNGRHLALWNSHGWYYQNKLDRWGWQRATLFTTVEDVLTSSFVLPFLVPMLEQAGANVYLPRERDSQTAEVIVDNTGPDFNEQLITGSYETVNGTGFGYIAQAGTAHQNPFRSGNTLVLPLSPGATETVQWTPAIPRDGDYAVSVSYQTMDESCPQAHYEVRHAGGISRFVVDQQIGGGTWVYLGTFRFNTGKDPEKGSVVLRTDGAAGQLVTADAVRFGGGMGSISRNGKTGGRPRWTEAARYYLQYAGFPDTLVFSQQNEKNDYVDDYRSRGRWVNYLMGGKYMEPWITKGKDIPGLKIPIDLSMAFHTDAGHHPGTGKLVGTLAIYSTRDAEFNRQFPGGGDRLASRDLADLLSAQIVGDIRASVKSDWPQRELWDQRYSEATYPTVPSVLLELLSHQNLADMRYALDPQFRFLVSRSIYKALLKFLAGYHQIPFVVQPLPVNRFHVAIKDGRAVLNWNPVSDPLETTAVPEKYIVYTRLGNQGWDNGILIAATQYQTPSLEKGRIYSFKVTAVNKGGESFPSNVLSVCDNGPGSDTVMVIDAFDRLSGPALISEGNFAGFAGWLDEGVAWGNDLAFIGPEYDFDQTEPWKDDDDPGHGASYDHLAGQLPQGNSFDHVFTHGQAIREAGFSFVSCSRMALEQGDLSLTGYRLADLIFGEEKTTLLPSGEINYTLYTPELRNELEKFLTSKHSGLFISGAYVGSDSFMKTPRNVPVEEKEFIKKTLGYTGRTDHASPLPFVRATTGSPLPAFDGSFGFNTRYRKDIYRVEAPDAIVPADSTGLTVARYQGNNKSAGVAFSKGYRVLTLGFPFETIVPSKKRAEVMKQILDYLTGTRD